MIADIGYRHKREHNFHYIINTGLENIISFVAYKSLYTVYLGSEFSYRIILFLLNTSEINKDLKIIFPYNNRFNGVLFFLYVALMKTQHIYPITTFLDILRL